jgi:hypothetical protein
MHEGTFFERRKIRPLESRVGRAIGYRLRFNLEGPPKSRTAPANICPDVGQDVWGVLYKITRRDMLRLAGAMFFPVGIVHGIGVWFGGW